MWLVLPIERNKYAEHICRTILVVTPVFTCSTGRMMRWCSSAWPPSRRSIGSSAWLPRDSATVCATWSPHLKPRWWKTSALCHFGVWNDGKMPSVWQVEPPKIQSDVNRFITARERSTTQNRFSSCFSRWNRQPCFDHVLRPAVCVAAATHRRHRSTSH